MVRNFKGVWFPKKVWLDERLSALDKIILLEIDSLDNEEKGCYASNEYLAEFCQCSERKITESISKLIKFEYVYVESFNGRQRVLKSRLSDYARQSSKNCEAGKQNFLPSNIDEYNNLDNNITNIYNNKENRNIKEKENLEKNEEKAEIQEKIKILEKELENEKIGFLERLDIEDNLKKLKEELNPQSKVEEKPKTEIELIFEFWNKKNIIKHSKFTEERKKAIQKRLKDYTIDEIKIAITHYEIILHDENYYWNYKWSIEDFLNRSNGFTTFLDDGSNWVSYNNKKKPRNPYQTGDEISRETAYPELKDKGYIY